MPKIGYSVVQCPHCSTEFKPIIYNTLPTAQENSIDQPKPDPDRCHTCGYWKSKHQFKTKGGNLCGCTLFTTARD